MNTTYNDNNNISNQINITTNYTDVAGGGLTVLLKINSSTRYYIVGVGKTYEMKKINIHFLKMAEIIFIQQILSRNDIKSLEINECEVPIPPDHIITIENNYFPGDIVLEGTTVKYTCEEYFTLYGSNETTCNNNTWIYPRGKPYCIGCGVSTLKTGLNRFNSSRYIYKAKPNKFPWHVYLYNKNKTPPEFLCGGSIISSKIVLSNNFCVEEQNSTKFTGNAKYYIEVGRYNWNTSLDNHYQQVDVEEILFEGLVLKMILLILNKHLQINEHVLPVCLDLKGNMKLINSSLIGVMPFGPLERNNISTTRINFFYISKPLHHYFESIYTYRPADLYCQGEEDRYKTQGNALTYKMPVSNSDNRYFIHSIFLYSTCTLNKLSFLEVFSFVRWIKSISDSYNQ